MEATVSHEDGSSYGWMQIEGLGIIKGTENRDLAEKNENLKNTILREIISKYGVTNSL